MDGLFIRISRNRKANHGQPPRADVGDGEGGAGAAAALRRGVHHAVHAAPGLPARRQGLG